MLSSASVYASVGLNLDGTLSLTATTLQNADALGCTDDGVLWSITSNESELEVQATDANGSFELHLPGPAMASIARQMLLVPKRGTPPEMYAAFSFESLSDTPTTVAQAFRLRSSDDGPPVALSDFGRTLSLSPEERLLVQSATWVYPRLGDVPDRGFTDGSRHGDPMRWGSSPTVVITCP